MLQQPQIDYRTHPLYPKIDWERINAGHIAIVDPMDNAGVLYLSEKDYRIQVRVSLSMDSPIVVLARPGDVNQLTKQDKTETPSSQNSPYLKGPFSRPSVSTNSLSAEQKKEVYESLSYENLRRLETKYGSLSEGMRKEPWGWEKSFLPPKRGVASWSRFLQFHVSALADLVDKQGGAKGSPTVSPSRDVVMSLIFRWGLILLFRSGGSLEPTKSMRNAFLKMSKDFCKILATRGPQALIMKMKNTLFFVNRYLSGQGNTDPFHLGEPVGLAKSGLPRIIPLAIRRRVVARDPKFIRILTSLLSSYKAIAGTYEEQDLVSITGPHPQISREELDQFQQFCKEIFWPHIKKLMKDQGKMYLWEPSLGYRPNEPPYIPLKTGPNSNVGILGAPLDMVAWDLCPVNYPEEWAKKVKDERTLKLMAKCREFGTAYVEQSPEYRYKPLDTGRVALLYEPAGKVRSIAIVDYWTQRLMYPVHKWMMEVLSLLPGDATHNQIGAVETYAQNMGADAKHWSIDLKSATDLIPSELYRILFSQHWGDEVADLWLSLLTDRWFRTPVGDEYLKPALSNKVVYYARGQPMGTLSSWASMALLHHSIVLYAAWKQKLPLSFEDYRVLGDDVVLGSESVASAYLEVTNALWIPTSKAKTLEGKLFIFASQIYAEGVCVTPMSLKEELGIRSFSQRLEFALRAVSRGWLSDHPSVSRFLRFLLRPADYKSSVRSWNRGSLGRKAQAALISAFGVGQRALARLGFLRESQCMPFLLALQDKVGALVGDQSSLTKRAEDPQQVVFELTLAVAVVQRVHRRARDMFFTLENTRVRFADMNEGFHSTGLIARSARQAAGWTGVHSYILNLPYPNNEVLEAYRDFPNIPLTQLHDAGLWPVIVDSYEAKLGMFGKCQDMSDYDLAQSEDWVDEEDYGTGVTFHAEESKASTPFEYVIPDVVQDSQRSRDRIQEILTLLATADSDKPLEFKVWDLVDEAFELLAKIPRVPSFLTLGSLEPDRSPKAVDMVRDWVRKTKEFDLVLRYLPMRAKLAAVDIPESGITLDEEAMLAYRPYC